MAPSTVVARSSWAESVYWSTSWSGLPTASSRPCWSQATWSHIDRIVSVAWLTMTTVLPWARKSANFSMHLAWKLASPTASTSSTSRMSGSTLIATENPRRTYMPDE